MAPGGARRSAGHQESRCQANPGRQETERPGAICAHRHARREPAGRPVVHLRLPQPGLLGSSKEFTSLVKRLAEQAPQSLRSAARTGAAVHSAAAEDRQDGHCGPAGQDRGQGLLPAQPQAGGALPAGGEGTGQATRDRRRGHPAQGPGAVVPDALQADLQPPVAVAGRRRLDRGQTAASGPACAISPR